MCEVIPLHKSFNDRAAKIAEKTISPSLKGTIARIKELEAENAKLLLDIEDLKESNDDLIDAKEEKREAQELQGKMLLVAINIASEIGRKIHRIKYYNELNKKDLLEDLTYWQKELEEMD